MNRERKVEFASILARNHSKNNPITIDDFYLTYGRKFSSSQVKNSLRQLASENKCVQTNRDKKKMVFWYEENNDLEEMCASLENEMKCLEGLIECSRKIRQVQEIQEKIIEKQISEKRYQQTILKRLK